VVEHFEEFEKLPYRLTMAVAPTKNIDRYEWFLEKATEIGVAEFIPLVSEHSERKVIKAEREEKVITAAVKQSLKAYHPVLSELTPFAEVVRKGFVGRKFIAHCGDAVKEKKYLASTLHKGEDVLILIGPEGDFSPEEVRLAVENGFEEITLGTQRFRTETAAVVAVDMVSIVNNL
jgi:16S rRNA (uracil1498-N3)-methyltransferase